MTSEELAQIVYLWLQAGAGAPGKRPLPPLRVPVKPLQHTTGRLWYHLRCEWVVEADPVADP